MAQEDIPNSVLGRLLSLEFLGMLVVIGISWGSLTTRVSGLDDQIASDKALSTESVKQLKDDTGELKDEVIDINRKLDVMGNNQEHFRAQVTAMDKRSMEILKLLEREYRDKPRNRAE